jgi:hypothetical protein
VLKVEVDLRSIRWMSDRATVVHCILLIAWTEERFNYNKHILTNTYVLQEIKKRTLENCEFEVSFIKYTLRWSLLLLLLPRRFFPNIIASMWRISQMTGRHSNRISDTGNWNVRLG